MNIGRKRLDVVTRCFRCMRVQEMPSSSMISPLYDKIFEFKYYYLPCGLRNAAIL